MDPIRRSTRGAVFIKADLHVHTPGSYDYKEDISPEEFVEALENEGVELVAITDHDCSGWYQKVREAAEETPIEVLPGVEITTPQGSEHQIHVTAIFPPEKASNVDFVLSNIGINPAEPEGAQANQKIGSICEIVRHHGGLPILAHIDEKAGADYELDRNNPIKQEIFDPERVAAIEVVDPEVRKQYPDFPAIQSSDAHSREELGRGYTYLKVTDPSFGGLRTALSDPDSRISFTEPSTSHAWITGIRCEGGFLDGRELQLNQNLNCLIGGKGTGKSTVIEHIRYALDISPRTDRIEEDYEELVEATLGPDGTVEVHLITGKGREYVVRRSFGEQPEIFRDGEKIDMEVQTFREKFFDIEIHSQRELLELARDDLDVLDLLDSYFDFNGEKRERRNVKSNLGENAQKIIRAREEKRTLEDKLRDYDAIQEQVAVMEEEGVREHIENQEEWEREDRILARLEEKVQDALDKAQGTSISDEIDNLQSLENSPENNSQLMKESPNNELINNAYLELSDAQKEVISSEKKIVKKLEETRDEIDNQREEWNKRREDRKETHKELKKEIKEETDVDIDEYFDLKEKLNSLEQEKANLDDVEGRLQNLNSERQDLLSELNEARRKITEARRDGIQKINKKLEDVRISLRANDNRTEFIEWVSEVLRGSGVRTDDKEQLAVTFSPEELARIVDEKNTDRLVEEVGVTETSAENIVNCQTLRDKLFEIEVREIHDRPTVEISDNSTWKALQEMSDGQRCTALLSIAMLERNAPLIVDQPEDMLDNEFIYDVVVEIIRRIKKTRQIITPTHNANIPILGDAEQIVAMRSDGRKGFFSYRGSVDKPELREKAQDILEGGEEAFSKRNDKYGFEIIL